MHTSVSIFTDLFHWLLGLDQGVLRQDADWKLGWLNLPSVWVIVLLIIPAVIGFCYLMYRLEPSVSEGKRYVMSGLRMGAIILILLMLFQPYLYNEIELERQSHIAVLVDTSESMSFNDKFNRPEVRERLRRLASRSGDGNGSGSTPNLNDLSRLELVRRVLNNKELNLLEKMSKDQILKMFQFSTRIQSLDPDAEITYSENDGATAIGSALKEVYRKQQGQRTSAIVILTDGQSNVGSDPIMTVRNRKQQGGNIPIYTVAVGSRDKPKDIVVTDVNAPEAAQANAKDPVVFNVKYRAQGPENLGRAELKLTTRDGTTLKSKEITVRGGGTESVKKIRWKPEKPGKYRITVHVGPVTGEIQENNNKAIHSIRVVDRKIRVFYFEGLPRYEYRFLKNTMIRDESLKVRALLQSADAQYPQPSSPNLKPATEFPSTRKQLSKYDVIIIGDVHPRMFRSLGVNTKKVLSRLKTFVEQLGGGVLFISGPRYNPKSYGNTSLEQLLPVIINSNPAVRQQQNAFHPDLTPQGKDHPIMQLEPETERNVELWENRNQDQYSLEPLRWFYPAQKAKLGAKTLAKVPRDVTGKSTYPLFVTHRFGRGRTMFVGTDDTWVWRKIIGDEYFYKFWSNSIRWLRGGRLSGSKRYKLRVEKDRYNPGDQVKVFAHVLDQNYRPEDSQTLPLHVRHDETNREQIVDLQRKQSPGEYTATFRADELGPYTAWVGNYPVTKKERQEQPDYAEDGFRVTPMNLESQNPAVNQKLLKDLSELTGGTFMYLDEIMNPGEDSAPLPDLVHAKPQRISLRPQREDLWDAPLFLLLFVTLLGAEWILRKKSRLI